MTPHKQLIQHDPKNGRYGDCQRTCVAAILDLNPSEVPHFCDDDAGDWAVRQAEWLRARGLACATVAYDGSVSLEQVMTWTSKQSPDVPMILLGTSSLGCNHVVVVLNGEIVCDPSGNGIVGPAIEGVWEVSMICVGATRAPDPALSARVAETDQADYAARIRSALPDSDKVKALVDAVETALNVALPVDGIACETVGDVIGMVEGVVAA